MVSKRFLKAILIVLCVLTLLIGNMPNISAAKNDILFDLTSLGVLEGVDVNEDYFANITRAEFSQIVVNLLGYTELAEEYADSKIFNDISESKYKGAINLLYNLKIISGTGADTFSPDSAITYPQVGKYMVNILGYSNIVESTQLYAYSMLAGSLGVFEEVDSSAPTVTWNDALIIAHNALDIDIMTRDFGMIGNSYLVVEGKTLRTSLATTSGQNIQRFKGIVTADYITYLQQAHPGMKPDQVEINGKVYKCSFDVPNGLVGKEVIFYVDFSNDNQGIVTNIGLSSKNTVLRINLDKISAVYSGEIKYFINDEDEKKAEVLSTAKVIYNDRWDKNASLKDIAKYKNGFVNLIDNNEDGEADYVFVYNYEDAIAERTYTETKQIYFANSQTVFGSRSISLDTKENPKLIVKIMNANGEAVAFEDIKENNILSIAKSLDDQVINIVVTDKIVTGVINEITDYTAVIGTDVYDYVTRPTFDPGTHVDAYINFLNRVFYMEKTKTENTYAYVLEAQQMSGIDSTVKVALIVPGHISETSKESFDDTGEADTSKTLFFRNDSKLVYELTDKVVVNDTRIDSQNAVSLIKNTVVSYNLDSDGRVSKLEILDVFNGDTAQKTYNQNGKTFSSKATEGFGITESETMSICVPVNAGYSDDDLLVPVKLVHSSDYIINAYDVDETSSIAGLVVINAEMRSGVAGSISPSTSEIATLKKVSTVLNKETGDESLRVNMITKDGEKSYIVSPLINSSVYNKFKALKKGDIFYYEVIEGTEELRNCQLIQAEDNYEGTGLFNVNQANEFCIGKAVNCRYNYVSAKMNRWTDCVTIDYGSGKVSYEIFKTGTPVIFIIDEKGKAELGTFDDIQCGNTVYVSTVYDTVRALAIRK